MATVFLIEPRTDHPGKLAEALQQFPLEIRAFTDGILAIEYMTLRARLAPDAFVIDATLENQNLTSLLASLNRVAPHSPILLIKGEHERKCVPMELKNGRLEILFGPVSSEQLQQALQRLLSLRFPKEAPSPSPMGFDGLISSSAHLQQMILRAKAYVHSRQHLLLRGERGVGKTHLAYALTHEESAGHRTPQTHVFESIFQTSALISEQVPGSTLIIDLPDRQQGAVSASGIIPQLCEKASRQDVRLVLSQRIGRKGRRGPIPDFEASGVATLNLLPLRSRPEDVISQFSIFSHRNALMLGRPMLKPDEGAILSILEHGWPGNTRELLYFVFQLYMTCEGLAVGSEQMLTLFAPGDRAAGHPSFGAEQDAGISAIPLLTEQGELRDWESVEADYLRQAFQYYRGRKSEIARKTGLGRSTLYRKAKNLDIA